MNDTIRLFEKIQKSHPELFDYIVEWINQRFSEELRIAQNNINKLAVVIDEKSPIYNFKGVVESVHLDFHQHLFLYYLHSERGLYFVYPNQIEFLEESCLVSDSCVLPKNSLINQRVRIIDGEDFLCDGTVLYHALGFDKLTIRLDKGKTLNNIPSAHVKVIK